MALPDPVRIYRAVSDIFNLRRDSDEAGTVENIRKNVDFHGANAWTLVFAIFIASIGLNMNSAAVIIGAMLISPLMGPILGIGLALGVNDELLLRKSFRNLSIAVFISILTSTVYFLLSPLHEVQSELLARTYPTFYDVLIAAFGGAAGIVSISRKERGPSVAGVAIATALMPPLCTAGFALSSGNLKFLAGALYLFLINSVFIALSTFLFVRYMKFQVVQQQEQDDKLKLRRWLGVIAFAMIAPSIFFAWSLLQESRFRLRAEHFLREEFKSRSSVVVNQTLKFSYKKPEIDLSLIGSPLTELEMKDLRARLPLYGLAGSELNVRQLNPNEEQNTPLRTSMEIEVTRLRQEQKISQDRKELVARISAEARLIFPGVSDLIPIEDGVAVVWQKSPSKASLDKLNEFLALRDEGMRSQPKHLSVISSK